MSKNIASQLIYKPINDDYEWIQYNNQLRLIHSIKDDMYQMNSIITACESRKQAKNWFDNQSTKELLDEFELEKSTSGIPRVEKSYENRMNVAPGLRGYYVHRYLVNAVAMWASPRYSLRIFKLLDQIASNERNELINQIESQAQTIAAKDDVIESQRSRMVPVNKENDYCYLIWKEEIDDPEFVVLHFVKRNRKTFGDAMSHYLNNDERWFYRDNLPISMTINEKIKELIPTVIPEDSYDLKGSTVVIDKEYLDPLYETINEWFDNEFQN